MNLTTDTKAKPLGPWQAGFDAWRDECRMELDPDHFQTTLLVQILEVRESLAAGDREHAAKEVNDIISVALNWSRWLGLSAEEIAAVAEARGGQRYEGQTKDILIRYCEKYGIWGRVDRSDYIDQHDDDTVPVAAH